MTDQFCDKHFFPHLSSDNLSAFRGAFRVEEQNGYGSGGCHVETHLQPVAKSKICRSHRTRVEVIFLHYRTFAALISVVVQFFFPNCMENKMGRSGTRHGTGYVGVMCTFSHSYVGTCFQIRC